MRRDRAWQRARAEERTVPGGALDVLLETKDARIHRVTVAPGMGALLQAPPRAQAVELVIGAGLLCQGQPAPPGAVYHWPAGAALRYDNPTTEPQAVLRVEVPAED